MRSRLPFFSSQRRSHPLMARINQALRVCLLALLFGGAATGCSSAMVIQYHGEVPFSDCGDSAHEFLTSCPTDRCIGVYLVPWCSYCTQLMPVVHELPEKAWRRGMSACSVVGRGPLELLRDYATRHSLTPVFDIDGVIPVDSYPTVFLFDKSGTIQKSVSGIYRQDNGALSPAETYIDHLLLD